MKNGNHKKRRSPLMIHAKTKFPDRALSCGNHTFLSYDCPAILQRGGEGSKFEVMTHKKDTEYSGAFCTSTLFLTFVDSRVAEVAREHGWHSPKSLDSDENFKPEHIRYFVAN